MIDADFKASAEKTSTGLELSLRDLTKKIEEQNLKLSDFEASKRRISLENSELLSQLQQQKADASLVAQTKSALVADLDEQKALVHEVIKDEDDLCVKSFEFMIYFRWQRRSRASKQSCTILSTKPTA